MNRALLLGPGLAVLVACGGSVQSECGDALDGQAIVADASGVHRLDMGDTGSPEAMLSAATYDGEGHLWTIQDVQGDLARDGVVLLPLQPDAVVLANWAGTAALLDVDDDALELRMPPDAEPTTLVNLPEYLDVYDSLQFATGGTEAWALVTGEEFDGTEIELLLHGTLSGDGEAYWTTEADVVSDTGIPMASGLAVSETGQVALGFTSGCAPDCEGELRVGTAGAWTDLPPLGTRIHGLTWGGDGALWVSTATGAQNLAGCALSWNTGITLGDDVADLVLVPTADGVAAYGAWKDGSIWRFLPGSTCDTTSVQVLGRPVDVPLTPVGVQGASGPTAFLTETLLSDAPVRGMPHSTVECL